MLSGARVFQGGGNEIIGNNLQEMVLEGAKNALKRLYSQFDIADNAGWGKVYESAKKGAPDALKAVGYDGEPSNNPVCKAILGFIAGSKSGADIRTHFEGAGFGWPHDAVDGALQVLQVAGLISAKDERGQTIDPKELERKSIGKVHFKVESTTITTAQRIQIRKLFTNVGLTAKQGEESIYASQFILKMKELAERAGGDAPKPIRPDIKILEDIRLTAGNDQLLALYNNRDELTKFIDAWSKIADRIEKRWTSWITLNRLTGLAKGIENADIILVQVENIERQRQLLEEPDLIAPLVGNLTQLLREELNKIDGEYQDTYQQGMKQLENDINWQQLKPEQRDRLLGEQKLTLSDQPEIKLGSTDDVIQTLGRINLSTFTDRVAAMSSRFDNVAANAAKLLEPKTQFIQVPRRPLKTEDDIDAWAEDVKQLLKAALQKGPIVIQ
jgi:hypothetical protein